MLSPGRRAFDRTGRGFEHAGDYDARFSTFDIRVKLEAFEEWGMDGARHRRIHPPVGRPLAGFFAIHDGSESGSLLVVRPLIDDSLTLTVALVNRPRPGIEESGAEAIEGDVSKVALIDPNSRETATVSVRGAGGLELARTGVIAIAIGDLDAFDVPVNLCHPAHSFHERQGQPYPGINAKCAPIGSCIAAYRYSPSFPCIALITLPPSSCTRRRLSVTSPTGK